MTPDYVPEEETYYQINVKNWQKIIIEKFCEYCPDAKVVENGLHIPSLKATIGVPDIIFSKYSNMQWMTTVIGIAFYNTKEAT